MTPVKSLIIRRLMYFVFSYLTALPECQIISSLFSCTWRLRSSDFESG
jgi:hypothetical protein